MNSPALVHAARRAPRLLALAALVALTAACASPTAEIRRQAALEASAIESRQSDRFGVQNSALGRFFLGQPEAPVTMTVVVPADPPPPPPEPDWRAHFDDVSKGAILVNLETRRLSYWSPGAALYREFPIGVPRTDDLEKTGRTKIVRRRKNPDWRPTPSMIKRNPDLPRYVGPGPQNPMGERALYLGWRYYAIHGTNDPSSIGRRTTSGCFRMFPEHIEWLYDQAGVGVPVVVIDGAAGDVRQAG